MVKEAPVVLTFCADFNRFNQWCRLRKAEPGYDNFLSFLPQPSMPCWWPRMFAWLQRMPDWGSVTWGPPPIWPGKSLMFWILPTGVVPVTTVTLGYPDEKPELTDRLPLEAVVHREKYRDYSDSDIDKHYREKELIKTYQEFVKENNKETLAQVFTDVRYKKDDNILFSKTLLEVLEQTGLYESSIKMID